MGVGRWGRYVGGGNWSEGLIGGMRGMGVGGVVCSLNRERGLLRKFRIYSVSPPPPA